MYLSAPSFGQPQFGTQSIGQLGGAPGSQMQMMMQLLTMMMSFVQMLSGGSHAMSCGCPGFGGQGMGSDPSAMMGPSPSSFLGLSDGQSSYGTSGQFPNGGGVTGSQDVSLMPQVGNPQSAGNGYTSPLDGNYRVSSGFGPRRAPTAGASTYHRGVDLAAPTGTPVRATKGGTVSISQHQTRNGRSTGYGNWIEIRHDDGTSSRYGHLNARGVQAGQRVEAGQVIGTVGNTGTSTGAHLHFEVRNQQGQAVDPQQIMRV